MVEMIYFLQYFSILQNNYLLELSSATCFLCILQTQLTRRNTSIPKKLKKMSKHDFHDNVIK